MTAVFLAHTVFEGCLSREYGQMQKIRSNRTTLSEIAAPIEILQMPTRVAEGID
jgi:hypothetical protein